MKTKRTLARLLFITAAFITTTVSAFYDPNLQRFINRDPIEEAGGINLYAYVGNNPINYVDPYGLQGIGAFLKFGIECGAKPPPLPKSLVDECLRLNGGRNRVELPDGRAVDLAGKPHIDPSTGQGVPTPHTHCPKPANPPPYSHIQPGRFAVPEPSTLGDILDSLIHLKSSLFIPATIMPLNPVNAPPTKVVAPPGFVIPPGFTPVQPPKPLPPGAVEA